MINVLMVQKACAQPRFYRVEVCYNLFGEYSVLREYGAIGAKGRQLVHWFSNLRDACGAADQWQKQALRRGYNVEGQSE